MKFLVATDFDVTRGSGYQTIAANLCDHLVKRGHEICVLGLEYDSSQHDHIYPIVPCEVRGLPSHIALMIKEWKPDVLLPIGDLTMQEKATTTFASSGTKYVGIFAVEGAPLGSASPWARAIRMMDHAFAISKFGEETVLVENIPCKHLPVGIDTGFWHKLSDEEKWEDRAALGISKEAFVVLTVADNHDRKCWPVAFKAFSEMTKRVDRECFFIAVTKKRPHFIGFDMFQLGDMYEISDKLLVINGGVHINRLRHLYSLSDVFLLTTKAEGLGIPLLEAMAMELPCVATETTAVTETLDEGRGLLINREYSYLDAFGTTWRHFPCATSAMCHMERVLDGIEIEPMVQKALAYVRELTWERTVDVFEETLGIKKPSELLSVGVA